MQAVLEDANTAGTSPLGPLTRNAPVPVLSDMPHSGAIGTN
jgi:hypothetical protein